MNSKINFIVFIIVAYVFTSNSQPMGRQSGNFFSKGNVQKEKFSNLRFMKKEIKKDVFLSRGWGAGGMPFSVLYMNPIYSSKQPKVMESYRTDNITRMNPETSQLRTLITTQSKYKNGGSSRSVIPQLFVSYGWGPIGKK